MEPNDSNSAADRPKRSRRAAAAAADDKIKANFAGRNRRKVQKSQSSHDDATLPSSRAPSAAAKTKQQPNMRLEELIISPPLSGMPTEPLCPPMQPAQIPAAADETISNPPPPPEVCPGSTSAGLGSGDGLPLSPLVPSGNELGAIDLLASDSHMEEPPTLAGSSDIQHNTSSANNDDNSSTDNLPDNDVVLTYDNRNNHVENDAGHDAREIGNMTGSENIMVVLPENMPSEQSADSVVAESGNPGTTTSPTVNLVSPAAKARMYNYFMYYKIKLADDKKAQIRLTFETSDQLHVPVSETQAYSMARSRFLAENFGVLPPSINTVKSYEQNLLLYNSFIRPRKPREATSRTPETIAEAKRLLADKPNMSMSDLARALGVSRMTAHNIVKRDLRYKSFQIMSVQKLLPRHEALRLRQAKVLKYKVFDSQEKLMMAIFTDEVRVDNAGNVIGRRRAYAASVADIDLSSLTQTHVAHGDSVMAWMGFNALVGVIGPFFFDSTVKAENYCGMLKEQFRPTLDAKLRAYNFANRTNYRIEDFYYVHDNAPAHFAQTTKETLLSIFKEKDHIIGGHSFGRNFKIPAYDYDRPDEDEYYWPPCSCDLMMNDFFAHGLLKRWLLAKDISSREKIKEAITEWASRVTLEQISNACASFHHRLGLVILAEGKHIEPYLRWPDRLRRDIEAAEKELQNMAAADDENEARDDFLHGWHERLIQVDFDDSDDDLVEN